MTTHLTDSDKQALDERYARTSRAWRTAQLFARKPSLLRHAVSQAATGAASALRSDPTLGWLNSVTHVRSVRPDAILGAEWGGMAGFMSALSDAAQDTDVALEIGCGGGRVTREAAGLVRSLRAVDVSEAVLDEARRTTAHLPSIDFATVRGFGDDFVTDSCTLVFSHDVFVHFEFDEVTRYALNVRRALRPGGRFVVSVYTLDSDDELSAYVAEIGSSPTLGARRVRRLPAGAYETIWRAAGFEVVTTTRSSLDEYSAGKRFTHLTYVLRTTAD